MSEYFKNPVHHVYKAWENSVSWIDLMIRTINQYDPYSRWENIVSWIDLMIRTIN